MKGVVLWRVFGMLFKGRTPNAEARILVPKGSFKAGGTVDIEVWDYTETVSWSLKLAIVP